MTYTRGLVGLIAALALTTGAAAAYARRQAPVPPADLVIQNGRILTLDASVPEAQALAARNGRIVAVGSATDVKRFIGPSTQIIDLGGELATPGFIEGHGHFTRIGLKKLGLELEGAKTWDDIVQMVAAAVKQAKPGQWIEGRGWHQEKWTHPPVPNVEGFPTHASLDAVSPNNPVVLTHVSEHGVFVNAKAMALSGITKDTPNPEGGEILKDPTGDPTGFLRERAQTLVKLGAGEPAPTPAEVEAKGRKVLQLADEEVTSKGITTFEDAGSPYDVIDRMKRVIDAGAMHVRLWVMARTDDNRTLAPGLDSHRMIGYGKNMLTVRAIKVQIDGALGSRGAWMLAPYSDKPDSTGLDTTPVPAVREAAQLAIDHNFQFCVHAIGDRANREVLNVYEDAFKTNHKNGKDLRWRIEHAQILSPADIPRFGQLGIIASMQTIHCTSDAPYVIARIGAARAEGGAYVWQKLMKSGAVVTDGTDAPVEDVDPIPNYYAAVTRQTADGTVFYGDQKMSRMEALRAYTTLNAYAAFEEDLKGTLAVGKLADVTVFTKDITTVPEAEIKAAKVAYTIIGGTIVYKRP